MSDHSNYNSRLQELGENAVPTVDFPAAGIRSAKVINAVGTTVGSVADFLYDIQSHKVRYAVIQLETPSSRRILAPIGSLEFKNSGSIEIAALQPDLIEHLPDYVKDEVNPGVENMIRLAFSSNTANAENGLVTGHPENMEHDDFYADTIFQNPHFASPGETPAKVVKAIFDDGLEAETALSELMAAGFSAGNIELSSAALNREIKDENIEMPQVANGGSVVSVKVHDAAEASKASEILGGTGSVSVYEQ